MIRVVIFHKIRNMHKCTIIGHIWEFHKTNGHFLNTFMYFNLIWPDLINASRYNTEVVEGPKITCDFEPFYGNFWSNKCSKRNSNLPKKYIKIDIQINLLKFYKHTGAKFRWMPRNSLKIFKFMVNKEDIVWIYA